MTFDPKELGGLYPWTPKKLALPGGVNLSYLDEGKPDAPPVLMLHGNPTWSFYYRGLVKALSGTRRCIVPDHIGAGLSDKPQDYPYTLSQHVENVERLVEHLKLENITLVVHDWGGAIGFGWATRNLTKVKRLVVLNTSAFRSKRIPASIALCRIPGLGALLVRGMNGFARAATVRTTVTPLSPAVKKAYVRPYDSWANRIMTHRFVQDIPMDASVPSWAFMAEMEGRLALLKDKPMLICWGGQDWCFDDSFLEGFKQRFPQAEVHRFADAGHYVLEDAGDRVVGHLKSFLERTASLDAALAP